MSNDQDRPSEGVGETYDKQTAFYQQVFCQGQIVHGPDGKVRIGNSHIPAVYAETLDTSPESIIGYQYVTDTVLLDNLNRGMSNNSAVTVLDGGCGVGSFSLRMALENQDCTAIGLNLSKRQLLIGQQNASTLHLNDRVRFVEGDLTNHQFTYELDAVVLGEMIFHLTEDQAKAALNNIVRQMKPGAPIVISSIYFHAKNAMVSRTIESVFQVAQLYTPEHIIQLLSQAGFQDARKVADLSEETLKGMQLLGRRANMLSVRAALAKAGDPLGAIAGASVFGFIESSVKDGRATWQYPIISAKAPDES